MAVLREENSNLTFATMQKVTQRKHVQTEMGGQDVENALDIADEYRQRSLDASSHVADL